MEHGFKAALFLAFTSMILLGCAGTRTITTGQKLTNLEAPIYRLGVIIQQSNFAGSAFGDNIGIEVANKALSELASRLPQRTQAVFAANDIENKTILSRSSGQQLSTEDSAGLNAYQYVLVISPTSARYSRDAIQIEMRAVIMDITNKKTIWTGAILFTKVRLAMIDDKVADEFSRELLVQLNTNGIIRLKNPAPVLPNINGVNGSINGSGTRLD